MTGTDTASGISRRVRRIAEINCVTVSWVATASSSNVESSARRDLPLSTPVAVDDRPHRVEDPFRLIAASKPRPPIGQHRVVEALIVQRRHRPRPSRRSDPATLLPRHDPTNPPAPATPSPSRPHPPGSTADPAPTETSRRTSRRETAPDDDQPRTPRRCPPPPAGGTTQPHPTTPDYGSLLPCIPPI